MKKRPVVISYGGIRVLLDTIATYWPYNEQGNTNGTWQHGIHYALRSGETETAKGDDKVSRNAALKFLDDHFAPTHFKSNKCQVCVRSADRPDCSSKHDCRMYNNFPKFKRV
jgi:uncharacterized protein (DUF1330 family)